MTAKMERKPFEKPDETRAFGKNGAWSATGPKKSLTSP